jgi:Fe-S cluster biosynthesis and repair protein YggX
VSSLDEAQRNPVKLSVWWKKNRDQTGILFFLEQEMEKFFFGEGSAKPAGYVPPQEEEI